MNQDNLISIKELIQRAKEAGFDFGKGDPINRLRYYTKLGLISHAQRKQAQAGQAFTVGHYPVSTLDALLKIQGIRRKDIGGEIILQSSLIANDIDKESIKPEIEVVEKKKPISRWLVLAVPALLLLIAGLAFGINKFNPALVKTTAGEAGAVLAGFSANKFLQFNSRVKFKDTELILSGDEVNIDQNLRTTDSPEFSDLALSSTTNQIVVGGNGTITWTPTAARVGTIPDATGTFLFDTSTQTITNKTISGSSNTLTNIPNSALSNSTITINPGSNLSGGGSISLGGSATLALKDDVSISTLVTSGLATLNTATVSGIATASSIVLTNPSKVLVVNNSGVLGTLTWSPTVARTVTIPNDSASNADICLTTGNCSGIGGVVGGSGTTNYLAKWTSTTNIGTGLLYDNGSGVGLSTTIPLAKFDVVGGSTTSGIASFSGSTGMATLTVDNTVGDLFTASSSGLSRFVITQNGNVGIGTTSPSTKLEINSGQGSGLQPSANLLKLIWGGGQPSDGTYANLIFQRNDVSRSVAEIHGGIGGGGTPANGAYGALSISLDNAGSLVESMRLAGSSTGDLIQISSSGVLGFTSSGGSSGTMDTGIARNAAGVLEINSGTAGTLKTLVAGNIGIGTSAPTSILQIKGSSTTQVASVSASTGMAGLIVDNTVGDLFTASSSGLSRFVIKQNGRVGIGTTNPGYLFNVVSAATGVLGRIESTGNQASLQINADSNYTMEIGTYTNIGAYVGYTGGGGFSFLAAGDIAPLSSLVLSDGTTNLGRANLRFGTIYGTLAHFSGSGNNYFAGNVGIGTSSPIGLLHVQGAVTGKALVNFNQNGGDQSIFTASQAGVLKFALNGLGTEHTASVAGTTSKAALIVDNTIGDLFTASSSGLSRFVITQNGNVGIGTTAPATKFEISGPTAASAIARIGTTGSGGGQWEFYEDGSRRGYINGTYYGGLALTADTPSGIYLNSVTNANAAILPTTTQGTTITLGSLSYIFAGLYSNSGYFYPYYDGVELTIKHAGAGQTSNMTQWLDANDSVLLSVNPNGFIANGSSRGLMNIPGAVSFNDITAIVATSSSYPSLTIRANSTQPAASISGSSALASLVVDNSVGDLFTASSSGLNRFVITQNGNVGIGSNIPAVALDVSGTINGTAYQVGGVAGASVTAQCVTSVSGIVTASGTCPGNGPSKWQLNSGVLAPNEITQSLAIGGTATTSALLFIDGTTGFLSNGGSTGLLNIPGAVSINDVTAIVATSSSYPTLTLRANSTQPAASISGTSALATLIVDNTVGDLFTASSSGLNRFVITQNGNVGIGSTAPAYNLDVAKRTVAFNSGIDGTLGAFSTANALPAVRYAGGAAFANGYLYFAGGYNGSAYQSTVYYAKVNSDGSVGDWIVNANSLPGIRGNARAVVHNGYIYLIGGNNGSGLASIVFAKLNVDGSTGVWKTNPTDLPAVRYNAGLAVSGDFVYMTGGSTGTVQTTVYYAKFNPDGTIGTWVVNANSLPAVRSETVTVIANGYIYAIGGNSGSAVDTVYYAKIATDGSVGAFVTGANSLPASWQSMDGGVIGGYIYTVGGLNGGSRNNLIYYARVNADGSVGAWSTNANNLPVALNSLNVAVANGYIYSLGGNSGSAVGTVYYASAARASFAATVDLLGLNGQQLASGSGGLGSSIYAGNIFGAGTLEVTGNSMLWGGLGVSGSITGRGALTLDVGSFGNTPLASISGATGLAGLIVDNSVGDLFTASSSGLNRFVITQNGNVGIGTTNPTTPLYVTGDMTLTGGDITGANGAALDLGEATSGDITVTGDIILAEDAFIGLSATTPRFVFDSTPTPDEIDVLSGDLDLNANIITNIGNAGTDFETDGGLTLADDLTVTGGDLITGNTTSTVFNTTATTLSLGGAATTLNLGVTDGVTRAINLGTGTGADTISIGTGATTADSIIIGNTGVATTLTYNTGVSTTTGFTLNANALSSGKELSLSSTSTAVTTGNLLSADWSPSAWSTSSGNLVNINLGSLADTTGNIFNISDDGSSIFSVSPQQSVFGIPTSFNAAGDVAIAYDINFTNPTASYIKSAAPLYLQSGELFNSSDLNLVAFNKGNIVLTAEGTLVSGAATVSGQLMVGSTTAAPAQFGKFLVTDSNTATSSAFIENSNTAAAIVGLTMKLGSTTLDTTSHFVNFLDLNGKMIGNIRAANTTTVAYQTQGIADFGEYMKRDASFSDPAMLSPGTVICFGSDGVKPCESGDTAKIVGVASDTTAFVGGDEKPENTIVGFLGQIKVKVATDSGSIGVGDPIGVGTGGRARKLVGRGYTVGMAIEPWTPGQDKVLVYVNPGYFEGTSDQGLGTRKSIDELQEQIASLSGNLFNDNATISGDLKVLGLTELANTNIGGSLQVGLLHFDDVNAEISSLTGMVTIDGELTAKKFNVSGDSAGKATILAGSSEIEITTTALNGNSLIFATPEDIPVAVSTTKTAANKFKIKLAVPAASNLRVNWWIVN